MDIDSDHHDSTDTGVRSNEGGSLPGMSELGGMSPFAEMEFHRNSGPSARNCRDGWPTGEMLGREFSAFGKYEILSFGRKVSASKLPSSCRFRSFGYGGLATCQEAGYLLKKYNFNSFGRDQMVLQN
jgi:hypothetical protein